MIAGSTILVVSTGHGRGQALQQRQLQLHPGGIAVTLATGRNAGIEVPEHALSQGRVGAVAVALAAGFDHGGQRCTAAGQIEQLAIDADAGGLQPRSVAALVAVRQPLVLARGQRLVQARRIRRIHFNAIAGAQLWAQQVRIDADQQARALRPVLVARAAVGRFVIPVRAADAATGADVERPRLLQEAVGIALHAADLFGRETPVPAFQLTAVLVIEVIARRGPARCAGVVVDARSADRRIGEQFLTVIQAPGHRAVRIDVALLGLHGPERGCGFIAAAVPALAGILRAEDAAAVQRAGGIAAIGTGIDVVVGGGVAAIRHGRRERRHAARIVGERIHEVALRTVDRFAVGDLQAEDRVPVLTRTATDRLQALVVAATLFGGAGADIDPDAVIGFLQDDVDHAGDRIGAVHRRGAPGQHFDPVDQRAGDVGQVDYVDRAFVGQRVVRLPAAVDQHQGTVGAEAAQVDGVGSRGEGVAEILALHVAGILGQRAERLERAAVALRLDLLLGDHGNRGWTFHAGAGDARAGDGDGLQLGGCIGRVDQRYRTKQRQQRHNQGPPTQRAIQHRHADFR